MTNYTTNDLEQRGLAEMAYERDLAAQTARAESAEARADALAAEVERLKRECADLWRVIGVGSVKQNEPPTLEDWRWVRSILDGASADYEPTELTAEVERLRAQLAAANEWRPVSDEPPVTGQYLLVYYAGNGDAVYHIFNFSTHHGWKVDLAGQWYWRPLPAPPQE